MSDVKRAAFNFEFRRKKLQANRNAIRLQLLTKNNIRNNAMEDKRTCKHCGSTLKKVELPPDSDFGVEYFYVCFNDECRYYQRGWEWMAEKYRRKASYRYKYDPFTKSEGPLPVASPTMWKDMIAE